MRPESEPTPERPQAAELPPDPFEGVKLPGLLRQDVDDRVLDSLDLERHFPAPVP